MLYICEFINIVSVNLEVHQKLHLHTHQKPSCDVSIFKTCIHSSFTFESIFLAMLSKKNFLAPRLTTIMLSPLPSFFSWTLGLTPSNFSYLMNFGLARQRVWNISEKLLWSKVPESNILRSLWTFIKTFLNLDLVLLWLCLHLVLRVQDFHAINLATCFLWGNFESSHISVRN